MLLPDLTGRTRSYATSWANSHNIDINWKVVSSGGSDGEIIAQNYPEAKRLDLIPGRTITLTVVERSSSSSDNESSTTDPDDEKEENDKPSTPTPSPTASPKPTTKPTTPPETDSEEEE